MIMNKNINELTNEDLAYIRTLEPNDFEDWNLDALARAMCANENDIENMSTADLHTIASDLNTTLFGTIVKNVVELRHGINNEKENKDVFDLVNEIYHRYYDYAKTRPDWSDYA